MKIGFSLSRCVLDIVEGTVEIEGVVVIKTSVAMNPLIPSHWATLWTNYTTRTMWSSGPWRRHLDKEKKFREVVHELYLTGRIFQPKLVVGFTPPRSKTHWGEIKLESPSVRGTLQENG